MVKRAARTVHEYLHRLHEKQRRLLTPSVRRALAG